MYKISKLSPSLPSLTNYPLYHYFFNQYVGLNSHHFMANRRGKVEAVTDFLFLGSKITVTAVIKLEYGCFLAGILCKLDSVPLFQQRSI